MNFLHNVVLFVADNTFRPKQTTVKRQNYRVLSCLVTRKELSFRDDRYRKYLVAHIFEVGVDKKFFVAQRASLEAMLRAACVIDS